MGFTLRYNLFYAVQAADVYGAFREFYGRRERAVLKSGQPDGAMTIYSASNEWVVVDLDSGWEWKERREAQLLVSRRLQCPGFIVFAYDGDYWGYEFFVGGLVLDHFVQDADEGSYWFPNELCEGNANLLAAYLPHLNRSVLSGYLVQKLAPNFNIQAGDEYKRFDECAVLDFIRYLGVPVSLKNSQVIVESGVFQSFWLRQRSD